MTSVTRALAAAGLIDTSFVTEEGKWRGSEVHRACQLYDQGKLNQRRLSKIIRPYFKAYVSFRMETHFVPIKIEEPLENAVLALSGRPDRFGLLRGSPIVLDLKTGIIHPWVALQTALYGFMEDSKKWWVRFAVQLKPDGKYRMKEFDRRNFQRDLAVALCCVRKANGRASGADLTRIDEWVRANR